MGLALRLCNMFGHLVEPLPAKFQVKGRGMLPAVTSGVFEKA